MHKPQQDFYRRGVQSLKRAHGKYGRELEEAFCTYQYLKESGSRELPHLIVCHDPGEALVQCYRMTQGEGDQQGHG